MNRDDVFALPLTRIGDFQFDDQVADVFPDMIARSVPGYGTVLSMTAELAALEIPAGSTLYDLGCSLGAASLLMASRVPPDCRILAVDNSAAMVERLRRKLRELPPGLHCPIEVLQQDVRETSIVRARLVVLNYTLQFIPIADRSLLLRRIFEGMESGGTLILTEKVTFADSRIESRLTELHHAFKRANGYSQLEIAQERTALENTLIPETVDAHQARIRASGFQSADVWFQCLNFVSILAIK